MYPNLFSVPSSFTDRTASMGVRQLCTLAQDLFTDYLYAHGCDGLRMERECAALWVFARVSYRFFRRPKWEERVSARCFVVRRSSCGLHFNMELRAEDGTPLAIGRQDAVLLDGESRRPRRLHGTLVPDDLPVEPEIFPAEHAPWAPEGAGEDAGTFRVWPDDTDMNGHANNIAYVRWALSAGGRQTGEAAHITFHYLRECLEGQTLEARRYPIPGGVGVELTHSGEAVLQAGFFEEKENG